MQWSELLKFVT